MTPANILTVCALLIAVFGGLWGIVRSLLARDRKTVEDQQAAMWRRLDTLRNDLQEAQVKQAELKARLDAAPDWEMRIRDLEVRLEKKLDSLFDQIRDLYSQALSASHARKT